MKRILLTLLAFFYLGVSSGMTVHFHYCMDKLVQMDLSSPKKDKCSFCGMQKKENSDKSCCKDTYQQVKVDQSKKSAQINYEFQQLPTVLLKGMEWQSRIIELPLETGTTAFINSPPRIPVPVFIRNCTYRI